MKNIFLLIFVFAINISGNTQKNAIKLDANSIVKDSSGQQYPYDIWTTLLRNGDFDIRAVNTESKNTEFLIFPLNEEEKMKRILSAPKPVPSKFFITGKAFGRLKTTDMNGNKIDLKDMKGKIVVLNYWFIKCPPCRYEIPHLNKIREEFATDSNVVFIAIALDQKSELNEFFKSTPFDYTIIDNGRTLTIENGISAYPTNVVINQEGKVVFHSSGYAINTPYWIKKNIEELRKAN